MITAQVSVSDLLNLDYLEARRLLLPSYDRLSIALVGCGGTGSWLAPSVVRIARLLSEKFLKRVTVAFIDPDHVEAKNCYRQNFCEAEIGRSKAETLAYRYGLAWGVEVNALVKPFNDQIERSDHWLVEADLRVLIGCVDNPAARRELDISTRRFSAWWLDCGNERSAGQVLLGCSALERNRNRHDPFTLPGYCSWLPSPGAQHPDLIEDLPFEKSISASEPSCDRLSCADLAMIDSQSLSINQRIAAEAADFLVRMLITRDLTRYAAYLDLAGGSTRSKYITPENIQ